MFDRDATTAPPPTRSFESHTDGNADRLVLELIGDEFYKPMLQEAPRLHA